MGETSESARRSEFDGRGAVSEAWTWWRYDDGMRKPRPERGRNALARVISDVMIEWLFCMLNARRNTFYA